MNAEQTIDNPVTGERLPVRENSAVLKFDDYLGPGEFALTRARAHPRPNA